MLSRKQFVCALALPILLATAGVAVASKGSDAPSFPKLEDGKRLEVGDVLQRGTPIRVGNRNECLLPEKLGVSVEVNPANDIDVEVLVNDNCEVEVSKIKPRSKTTEPMLPGGKTTGTEKVEVAS